MSQSIDERLVLDNVVSMLEHCVVHISDPSPVFLQQVESDVVRLIFSGASEVSITIHLFTVGFLLAQVFPGCITLQSIRCCLLLRMFHDLLVTAVCCVTIS